MIPQRSTDWHLERAGVITGSRFKDVMAVSKSSGKPLKAREDYLFEIVAERLTKEPVSKSHGLAGAWGTDVESFAQLTYEIQQGVACIESGLIKHPSIENVGCSPDGLIGSDGGVEVKCPMNSSVHLKTAITKQMPDEHIPQVQGCMWVTGRKWWDFVSFDPRMPDHLQIYIQRINRDEDYIKSLETNIKQFLADVDKFMEGLDDQTQKQING